VIVTMTPWQVFSELDSQRRFVARFLLTPLAAINEGLAAGFHSPGDPGQLARLGQLAGMPGDVAPLGLLAVGYPADDPLASRESVARRRKPIDEMIWWRR
jgi:nitroreductase